MPLSIIVMLQASIVLLAQTETIGAEKNSKSSQVVLMHRKTDIVI